MIELLFHGDKFSPKRCKELTGINLTPLQEAGQIARIGRWKGQICPYGLAWVDIPEEKIDAIIVELNNKIPALVESGVTEITVENEIFEDMYVLEKIEKLNSALAIFNI